MIQRQCKTCFLILTSLAAIHLACENYKGGGGEKLAPEDFNDAMTEAYCDRYEKCELEWFWKYEDNRSCEDAVWYLTDIFEILIESVQAGRLQYDGESAHECLSSFIAAECYFSEEVFQFLMCDRAFTGGVNEGGTCYLNDECAEGLRCHGRVPGDLPALQGNRGTLQLASPKTSDDFIARCEFCIQNIIA